MDQKILQITFKYNLTTEELGKDFEPLADPISQVPGLLWKTWTVDEKEHLFSGIYLFATQDALDAYIDGEIVAGVLKHPALSNFDVKKLDIIEEFSLKTRAPVGAAAIA